MELSGKILIAMPGMGDPRFAHSVILVCVHSAEGAMGLVVNKPARDLSFESLLQHLDIPHGATGRDIRVHIGGPVERGRGFVLHSREWRASGHTTGGHTTGGNATGGNATRGNATGDAPEASATMDVPGGYAMTATLDILDALAQGRGPDLALLALGYSGWGPGQLEAEIARNDWLTADPEQGLVFSMDDNAKWAGALRGMGIDPLSLSAQAGRA